MQHFSGIVIGPKTLYVPFSSLIGLQAVVYTSICYTFSSKGQLELETGEGTAHSKAR